MGGFSACFTKEASPTVVSAAARTIRSRMRSTAAPSATSSAGPCRDGSVNRISMPTAAGFPRATMSRNLACTARGHGHARLSPSKSSSSMVTTTMGETGGLGPRTVNWASRAFSSAISKKRSGLTAASTTTARPARLPARSTRQEAVRDRTDVQPSTTEVAAAVGKRLHSAYARPLVAARRVLGRRVHLGGLQRHAGSLLLLPDQRRGRAGVPGRLRQAARAQSGRGVLLRLPRRRPDRCGRGRPAPGGAARPRVPEGDRRGRPDPRQSRLDLSHLAAHGGRLGHRGAGADVARPELRPSARPAPPVLTRHGGMSERIIIAEDDEDLAFVLREALRRQRYDVDVAPTAGGMLDGLKATPYDLILLDVRLPDMDGLDAIPRCRELVPTRRSS